MTSFRFPLSGLMGAVAVVAVGLAALHSASRVWAAVILLATITVFLAAVLGSVYRTGEARAFWLGTTVFGWFYMILAFAPWFDDLRYLLDYPPKALRAALWTVRVPDGGDTSVLDQMDTDYDHRAKQSLGWPAWHIFGPTAHCLIALLFGLAGGMMALYFRSHRRGSQSCQEATLSEAL